MKCEIVSPEKVYAKYLERKAAGSSNVQFLIAENREFGVEVYLEEDEGYPKISVEMDSFEVYSAVCLDAQDCEDVVKDIYSEFLTSNVVSSDLVLNTTLTKEEEISEREAEIDDAVFDFVACVSDDDKISTEIYDDLKEHFLEYMARKWDIPIRRPMFLLDNNGDDVYEEYPYECMEFEDNNPIYNKAN